MCQDKEVRILFVDEDSSACPRIEAFFQSQLAMVAARPHLHFRSRLPERAVGFDLVSLDGRGLLAALRDQRDLRADLGHTPIVNLHADEPGAAYGHLRRALGRPCEGRCSDGLWVFPKSWMAPWFEDCLEFPELGLPRITPLPQQPLPPDRTWDRRTSRTFPFPLGMPEAAALHS